MSRDTKEELRKIIQNEYKQKNPNSDNGKRFLKSDEQEKDKELLSDEIKSDVEEFIKNGGNIKQIPDGVSGDERVNRLKNKN